MKFRIAVGRVNSRGFLALALDVHRVIVTAWRPSADAGELFG